MDECARCGEAIGVPPAMYAGEVYHSHCLELLEDEGLFDEEYDDDYSDGVATVEGSREDLFAD